MVSGSLSLHIPDYSLHHVFQCLQQQSNRGVAPPPSRNATDDDRERITLGLVDSEGMVLYYHLQKGLPTNPTQKINS